MSAFEFEQEGVRVPADLSYVQLVSLSDVHAALDAQTRPLSSELLRTDRRLCGLGEIAVHQATQDSDGQVPSRSE